MASASSIVTDSRMACAMSSHEAFRSSWKLSHVPTAHTSMPFVCLHILALSASPNRYICHSTHAVPLDNVRFWASSHSARAEHLANDIISYRLIGRRVWGFLIAHPHGLPSPSCSWRHQPKPLSQPGYPSIRCASLQSMRGHTDSKWRQSDGLHRSAHPDT